MFDLREQFALVTGGSQGIGLEVARQLFLQGATVEVWARNRERLLDAQRSLGPKGRARVVDVCDERQVADATEQLLAKWGEVDILINNAGAFGPVKSALDYSLQEWEEVLRVNLTSQFLVCKAVVPYMVRRGYGRVVNLASIVGRDANPNAPAYSAAKAGVIRFTQALGRSLAKSGVLVNCVAPAATRTAFFNGVGQEYLDRMLAQVPMGRFGEVGDVAALICWLASTECSYSAGAVFDCSGGRHD